jgi:transcriptional regulator with XRE-family HTH domain
MSDNQAASATTARTAIAAEVRAELARHGKTQREAGEVLGLPQSAVSLRISGERPFRAEELILLAADLGIPAERFLNIPAAEAGVE